MPTIGTVSPDDAYDRALARERAILTKAGCRRAVLAAGRAGALVADTLPDTRTLIFGYVEDDTWFGTTLEAVRGPGGSLLWFGDLLADTAEAASLVYAGTAIGEVAGLLLPVHGLLLVTGHRCVCLIQGCTCTAGTGIDIDPANTRAATRLAVAGGVALPSRQALHGLAAPDPVWQAETETALAALPTGFEPAPRTSTPLSFTPSRDVGSPPNRPPRSLSPSPTGTHRRRRGGPAAAACGSAICGWI